MLGQDSEFRAVGRFENPCVCGGGLSSSNRRPFEEDFASSPAKIWGEGTLPP